ncbi:unnamed protein product [Periconia digitata]|uniref:Uncharacterized protein n=1 Tax=Periconia digitata TaxID=1303443 RepID=A0A9W4UM28_9PLEO|nr:unnamed protein product [Periconia digitata]
MPCHACIDQKTPHLKRCQNDVFPIQPSTQPASQQAALPPQPSIKQTTHIQYLHQSSPSHPAPLPIPNTLTMFFGKSGPLPPPCPISVWLPACQLHRTPPFAFQSRICAPKSPSLLQPGSPPKRPLRTIQEVTYGEISAFFIQIHAMGTHFLHALCLFLGLLPRHLLGFLGLGSMPDFSTDLTSFSALLPRYSPAPINSAHEDSMRATALELYHKHQVSLENKTSKTAFVSTMPPSLSVC